MCEEFSDHGAEVELWAPARLNRIKEDVFSFYGIKNNFTIKEIKSFDFLRFGESLGRFSFWLQNICFTAKLFLLKPDKNAIIYTRNPEIVWLFNLKGYKIVLESHSWPSSKSRLFKYLASKSDKLVAITHGLEELFIAAGFSGNRLLVAPDGVDLEKFDISVDKVQARQKLNLPLDEKIILYCGSIYLYGWKGVDIFLAAAKILPSDCLAVIVGGELPEVAKIKSEYGGGNLLLAGRRKRKEIPYYLKAADILVLPNKRGEKISEIYTSPLKLFEYMASGRPIVAADLPSAREILSESNCLFFRPNDAEDLSRKIGNLLSSEEMSERIARQAYFDVKKYSWTERAKAIINFINL